jgi:serine/threonine-protein kinase
MAELDATSALSLEEEEALGRLQGKLFGREERRFKVERYVLVDRLGTGGAAVVYRAFDPELDRRVAIKLLAPTPISGENTQSARDRVQGEARLIAQLSHPNVVPVYDVGDYDLSEGRPGLASLAGVADPRMSDPTALRGVFIVMEYVEGATLSDWIDAASPSLAERLEAFLQAGRGLEAAHEAGLVHRDFKPLNTIRGDDGRVRVLDFGIARWLDDAPVVPASSFGGDTGESSGGSIVTDTISGTPRYMSPEQHSGGRIDARSDQFSFALALYEGIFGKTPYDADSLQGLGEAKSRGEFDAQVDIPGLSPRLKQALFRALEPDPEKRFGSMTPLLEELERELDRPRKRRVYMGAAALAAAVGTAGLAFGQRGADPCTPSKVRAELTDVWDEDVRSRVKTRFEGLEVEYAQTSFASVAQGLDVYADQWTARKSELCRDRRESTEVTAIDAELLCLDMRRNSLAALGRALEAVEVDNARRAVTVAERIETLESCRALVQTRTSAPTGDQRSLVLRLEAQLDEAIRANELDGDKDEARELADRTFAEAKEAGLSSTAARVEALRCTLEREAGKFDEARTRCHNGLALAREAGDAQVSLGALINLVGLAANWQRDHRSAREFLALAEAEVRRQRAPAKIRADLARNRALLESSLGRPAEAAEAYREAISATDEALGPGSLENAVAYNNRGLALYMQGKHDEAIDDLRRALEIRIAKQGEMHPMTGDTRNNIGAVLLSTGAHDEALIEFEATLKIARATYGETHQAVAGAYNNIGNVMMYKGRYAEAKRYQEQALAVSEKVWGEVHDKTAMTRTNLGNALDAMGQHEAAMKEHHRAVGIRGEALPKEHLHHAWSWVARGKSLYQLGRLNEAKRDLEAARDRFIEQQGEESGALVDPLYYLARIAADQGDEAGMETLLKRVEALSGDEIGADFAAQIAFCRAQPQFEREPARAHAAVEAALKDYPEWKLARNDEAYLRAWLDSHPAP